MLLDKCHGARAGLRGLGGAALLALALALLGCKDQGADATPAPRDVRVVAPQPSTVQRYLHAATTQVAAAEAALAQALVSLG